MNLLSSSIPLITDVVLIAILLIFALVGCKKGFVKTFLSTFGTLISLIVAVLLCSSVTNFLETRFSLVTTISESVSGVLAGVFGEDVMSTTLAQANPETLNQTNLTAWLITIVLDIKSSSTAFPPETTLNQVISPVFSYYITCVISVIGLFIILKIIFFIIGEVVKGLHKIKLIGTIDKILGFVLGLIKGLIFIQVLFLIVKIVPLGFCQDVVSYLAVSSVANIIDSINIISLILQTISNVNLTEIVSSIIIK